MNRRPDVISATSTMIFVAAMVCLRTAAAVEARAQPSVAAPALAGGACFDEAASRYRLHPALLRAIAQFESRMNPAAVHNNSDGTRDVGLMQINSRHFGGLKTYGITEARLLAEPCLNVNVGAWVLSGFIQQFGPTWRAVGAYNAGQSKSHEPGRVMYVAHIQRVLAQLEVGKMLPGRKAADPSRAPSHMLVVD